jgi:O-antigen ligase
VSNETITYVVAAASGVIGLAVYIGLILVPAWRAYSHIWERAAAAFLTFYVLAAFMLVGVLVGAVVVWTYDRWAGTG